MFRKTIMTAVLAVGAATIIIAGPALAMEHSLTVDTMMNGLPGPGVLGLITIGIIGAIVLARLRK